jgi:hypothetical protein
VKFAGTVMTGAERSVTVTLNAVEAAWPLESLAEQLTLDVPIAKVDPEAGVQVTVTDPSTASVAVGFVYATAAPADDVASAPTGGAVPKTGGSVS